MPHKRCQAVRVPYRYRTKAGEPNPPPLPRHPPARLDNGAPGPL